jgi:hypothetical protein
MAKWPDAKVSGNVKYTCVTSFLFLRFFCAAILGSLSVLCGFQSQFVC